MSHCLGAYWPETCPSCGPVNGIMLAVCDDPYTEQVQCSRCDRVLKVNGRKLSPAAQASLQAEMDRYAAPAATTCTPEEEASRR